MRSDERTFLDSPEILRTGRSLGHQEMKITNLENETFFKKIKVFCKDSREHIVIRIHEFKEERMKMQGSKSLSSRLVDARHRTWEFYKKNRLDHLYVVRGVDRKQSIHPGLMALTNRAHVDISLRD